MAKLETDIFSKFDKQWALLCAGTKEKHNTMTVSWGGMGTLWGRPVVTVYVRPTRYTFGFLNESEYFTLSFYPEEYKKALALMGSRSGRDIDKDAASGLTVKDLGRAVTYAEAETTLICRKIYYQDMAESNIPADILRENYQPGEVPHRMFIGEVVEITGR